MTEPHPWSCMCRLPQSVMLRHANHTAPDHPRSCCRGILDFALTACREGDASLVPSACETLAEAFERCPDPLLAHLQPHLLDLSALALHPPESGSSQWQQALIALFVVYVQSCADSVVRAGRSDLLRALFAVSHAAKDVVGAAAPAHEHAFAAAHVVDAAAMVGRALLKAVEDEGGRAVYAVGGRTAGVAASAQLQGMSQVYLEGAVGMLPLHQVRSTCSVRVMAASHSAPTPPA